MFQGPWLGGANFRDAVWNTNSSYCSWPFFQCSAGCEEQPYLEAL